MGLWERIADRREQHKQKITDGKQDGEIKELREELKKIQSGNGRRDDRDRSPDRNNDRRVARRGDDVENNFERDSYMIQRMYDDMYGRMGNKFAQGDGTPLVIVGIVESTANR